MAEPSPTTTKQGYSPSHARDVMKPGFIVKLVLMMLIDALGLYGIFTAYAVRSWGIIAIMAVLLAVINWIYFCTQEFVIALKLTRISSVLSVLATFIYPTTAVVLLAPFGLNVLWWAPVIGAALTVLTSIGILIHIRTTHFAGIPVRHSQETR